jgi:hypothetical protein
MPKYDAYFGFATTRRMVATRFSNSIGLASNSSQPVATAFSRSLASAYAEMPMIGMWPVWASFFRPTHHFPAILVWHFEVHQNYVRVVGHRQLAALLAVVSRENLEIAEQLKPRLEHVEVVVVVFDV